MREIAENYDALAARFKLNVAPPPATLTALSKELSSAAVKSLGLPLPRSVPLDSSTDLEAAAAEVGFPAILKPAFGSAFQLDFKTKVFQVPDLSALRAGFARASAAGHHMLLQELIPGPDENLATCRGYVTDAGLVPQFLTTVKLSTFPPHFGIGQVQAARNIPDIVEPTRMLLDAIGYRGALFSVEWKLDPRDRKYKFIEFNARTVASIGLARPSGCDVLDMMWRDKMGLPQKPPERIRWGYKIAHIKNGLLLHSAFPNERPTLRRYLSLYCPPLCFHAFKLRDPKPFLADLWPVIARRFKRRHPAGESPSPPA